MTVIEKPILLGALFQAIGTPNVPLFNFSPAKRAYMGLDLQRWAGDWGVAFQFPKHFPLRTVTALRLAIVEPELSTHLYRWAWVDGLNIGDTEVLIEALHGLGLDGQALISRAQTPEIKQQLRQNTSEAIGIGICGVPTFAVTFSQCRKLIWGQDRLSFLNWMLKGWCPSDDKDEGLS